MKKRRTIIIISVAAVLVIAFSILLVAIIVSRSKSNDNLSIDTNIGNSSADAEQAEETPILENTSGINAEPNDTVTPLESQSIADMIIYLTSFQPDTDESNNVLFTQNTITDYLSSYFSSIGDDAKSYTYSDLNSMSQLIFGCTIPAVEGSHRLNGWNIINGKFYPSPNYPQLGSTAIVSVETDDDGVYYVTADIANCPWQPSNVYRLYVTLLPNPDSPVGFTFKDISYETHVYKQIPNVEVSSSKPANGDITYTGANLIDGKMNTAWCENVNGNGILEWIRLYPAEDTTFSAIGIVNGNTAASDGYSNSSRVKRMLIQFPGGYTVEAEIPDGYNQDSNAPYVILLGGDLQASWIKISIEDVYSGDLYDDTYITELRLY